ncbi:MAG: MFS transporter [Actinomycetota bacterium]|nr:MFS transporter [Actinomycetota bacterium]
MSSTVDVTPGVPPLDTSRTSDPVDHQPRSRNLGLALAVIGGAQLMIVLDGTIVNIALPHIQTDLGFSQSSLSWVVNAYALALGSLLLLGGRLGDLLGRRRMFVTGVLLFAAASLVGGLALDPTMLVISRIVQGAGAAIASPAALSLVTTTFPAGKERNRAMGVYAAMSGAGAAIGLILGGALTEIDWRWTFFVNVPIGLLVAAMAPRVLVESERSTGSFDLVGTLTGTFGLVGIVYGLTHAAEPSGGWGSSLTITCLVLGVVFLAAFVAVERRNPHALLPIRILADRTRGVSLVTMLLVGAGMFAMFYFLGLYIQQVLGYSPIKAGLAFLPFSVGIVAGAGTGSALASRVDPRWISGPGALVGAGGMLGLTRLTVDSGYTTGLLPWIVILAVGLGLTFVPLTLTAVAGVREEDAGAASAALNTAQQIGGAIGLAALTTVFTRGYADKAAELGAVLQSGSLTGAPAKAAQDALPLVAQTYGSTRGFLVGAMMIALASVLVFTLLTVKHEELAAREDVAGPHLG